MIPGVSERARNYKYKEYIDSAPLDNVTKFVPIVTKEGEVQRCYPMLLSDKRDSVAASMSSMFNRAGYFKEVSFFRTGERNNEYEFLIDPVLFAKLLCYADNKFSLERVLAMLKPQEELKKTIKVLVRYNDNIEEIKALDTDSFMLCYTAHKILPSIKLQIVDEGRNMKDETSCGLKGSLYNNHASFKDYFLSGTLRVTIVPKEIPAVAPVMPKVNAGIKEVSYAKVNADTVTCVLTSLPSRDGYVVYDHSSAYINEGKNNPVTYVPKVQRLPSVGCVTHYIYTRLPSFDIDKNSLKNYIFIVASRSSHILTDYYEYDTGKGFVYSLRKIILTTTFKDRDDNALSMNIINYADYDSFVFLGDEAMKVKQWCARIDPYGVKEYKDYYTECDKRRLIVIDKYLPPGILLGEKDKVYNIALRQIMDDVYLNKIIPFFGIPHPNYLIRLGFHHDAKLMGRIDGSGVYFPVSHNNVDLNTRYLIPGFEVVSHTYSRGFAGMSGVVNVAKFDDAYMIVTFSHTGTVTFRYYNGDICRDGYAEINDTFKLEVHGTLAVSDLVSVALPRFFSSQTCAVLTKNMFVGSHMMHTYLHTLPDLVYNSEYDIYLNPHGKKKTSSEDAEMLSFLCQQMSMSPAAFCNFAFGISCEIDVRMNVIIKNFNARYVDKNLVYKVEAPGGYYYVMKYATALKMFSKAGRVIGYGYVPGLRHSNDVPLVRVKIKNKETLEPGEAKIVYVPTWHYMMV